MEYNLDINPVELVKAIVREYSEELSKELELTYDDAPYYYLEDKTGLEYKITIHESYYELACDTDRTKCGDWYVLYEGSDFESLQEQELL